jgi:hypothetical protein
MKTILLTLSIVLTGCVKESDPPTAPPLTVPFVPTVTSSLADYDQAWIVSRVPDSTLWLACRTAYNGRYSEQLKAALADSFVQRAHRIGATEVEARGCLTGSGQMQTGTISLLYRAEVAYYYGVRCWILEFARGTAGGALQEFRCFVMDARTFNPRLVLPSPPPAEYQARHRRRHGSGRAKKIPVHISMHRDRFQNGSVRRG